MTITSEHLSSLVAVIDQASEKDGWGTPPTILRITGLGTEGFDLGVRPLEHGDNVVDALSGFTAPDEWVAIGVLTEGKAHAIDGLDDGVKRVRCIHIVDRDGTSASSLRLQGEAPTMIDDLQPTGRIDDVCRRALDLDTPGPECSTLSLWTAMWLAAMIVHHPTTWAEVAELHPVLAMMVSDDETWPSMRNEAVEHLPRLATALAGVHTWSSLRAACAEGVWECDDVPPDVAAWLDDGAFSRWVMGSFPSIDTLALDALHLLTPTARQRAHAALIEWKLL